MILGKGKRFGDPWWRWSRTIKLRNPLNQHMSVWGEPGCGKSTFLFSQLIQDIAAHRPFILFDSHSDLFHQAIHTLIEYNWNPEDVVILDPADRTWGSPGINVLEVNPLEEPYEVVDEILSAFKAIWRESWGARMEDLLRNTFLALQEASMTLAEAELFLTDPAFRKAIVQNLTNPDVKSFWQKHFAGLKEAEQKFFVEAPRNKLSAFLGHPALKDVFSQKQSTIRFEEIMNTGKCCLINLSRNHLKEGRGLFGALLLAKLALSILSREEIAKEERIPVTIYADEAHEYFVREFCLLIATGARKFGIGYRTFSQSPAQYRDQYRDDADILFATCATQVAFNLDRLGAERLAKELFSFSGNHPKHQQRDLWGPVTPPAYFTVQEETENAISELMNQQVGECIIRSKGPRDTGSPWMARIPYVTHPEVDPSRVEEFRERSAAIYYAPTNHIQTERTKRIDQWSKSKPSKVLLAHDIWEQG